MKEMQTKITTNIASVCSFIKKEMDFIAIGEIHNSRSAIKFIMENIDTLAPNDGKKTYLLTEFFPTDRFLIPSGKNQKKYIKAKLDCDFRDKIDKDISQRESDKPDDGRYTLEELYKLAFLRNIAIFSVGQQNESSKKLHEEIIKGNIKAYVERVLQVNEYAFYKAHEILLKYNSARILFFAGMGHTASGKVKKKDKNGEIYEMEYQGIDELMRKAGYKGISISIHDPELCQDADFFKKKFTFVDKWFTKYAIEDDSITIDKPDFLLFLNAPSKGKKVITKKCESIFLPGEYSFDIIEDQQKRKEILQRMVTCSEEENESYNKAEHLSVKNTTSKKKKKRKKANSAKASDHINKIEESAEEKPSLSKEKQDEDKPPSLTSEKLETYQSPTTTAPKSSFHAGNMDKDEVEKLVLYYDIISPYRQ